MPPKGKKESQKEEEQPEPLQAVLLTDSYQNRFAPFTLERPRCLLPLSNTPLIEYTLEFLAGAGVEEIFIYCGNHQDQIEAYLSNSKWMSNTSPFLSFQIVRSVATSIGDAMRDLDKRELLKNDFLVLYGDMISNFPIGPALEAHKKRRAEDKNCIMTMVLRKSHSQADSSHFDMPVFVCNPRQNRCLHYETIRANDDDRSLLLDEDTLKEPELELRADLLDCGIDICTPDVLALWSDNFDFQTPRENFLYSVLKDYELNGKKLFMHIIDDYYVKRVENLRQYASITRDVIGRWAYPYCPDTNLLQEQNYQLKRNQVYLDRKLNLSRSCKITAKSVIGANCKIGKNSIISNSVIGPSCTIGDNVTIENSYIWSHAIIKSGTVIKQAIVAEGATIGENCILEPGALVSFNVVIGNNITIKGTSKITRMKRIPNSDDLTLVLNDTTIVGPKGTGAEYIPDEDDDESTSSYHIFNNSLAPDVLSRLATLNLSTDSISVFSDASESESDSDSHFVQSTTNRDRSTASSFISVGSTVDEDDDEDPASAAATARAAHDFHHEASSSLLEALQRNSAAETVLLELNGLRLSTNASAHSVRRAVAHAFAKHLVTLVHAGTGAKSAVDAAVGMHAEMWRRTVFDRDSDDKADQADLLLIVQSELKSKREGETILFHLLQTLVQLDIVEAEGVEQWWGSEKSSAGPEMVAVRAKSKAVVDFLLADDEESSEEESEEEE